MMQNMDYLKLFSGAVRELPCFAALAQAVLGQADDFISLIPSLLTAFSVDTAEGVQLDLLGESLGLKRAMARDDSDDSYRDLIKAKFALWRWDGTNESVPGLLEEAFPGEGITMRDNGDMTVTVEPAQAAMVLPIAAGVRKEG